MEHLLQKDVCLRNAFCALSCLRRAVAAVAHGCSAWDGLILLSEEQRCATSAFGEKKLTNAALALLFTRTERSAS